MIGLFLMAIGLSACAPSPAGAALSEQEQLGQRLFMQTCAACHSTSGDAVIVGPSLAGVATRAETRVAGLDARAYIEQSILDPSAYVNPGYNDLMPKTFGSVYTAEEIDALVAFLLTLK